MVELNMTVLVDKSAPTVDVGIDNLLKSAKADYVQRYGSNVNSDVGKKMVNDFNNGLLNFAQANNSFLGLYKPTVVI